MSKPHNEHKSTPCCDRSGTKASSNRKRKKTPTSLPQFAEIDLPFGDDAPIVHCPVCGQATMETAESGEGRVTACPHLVFMFVDLAGEFEYVSNDFEQRLEKAGIAMDSIEDFKQTLIEAGYGSELLVLDVTSSGMACGPFAMTVTHAFDFSIKTKP